MREARVRFGRWRARHAARLRTRSDAWIWSRLVAVAVAGSLASAGGVVWAASSEAYPATIEGNCVIVLPAGPVGVRLVQRPYKRGTWIGTATIAPVTASPVRVLMDRVQVTTRTGTSYTARLRGGYVSSGARLVTNLRHPVKVGSVLRVRVQDTSGAVASCSTS